MKKIINKYYVEIAIKIALFVMFVCGFLPMFTVQIYDINSLFYSRHFDPIKISLFNFGSVVLSNPDVSDIIATSPEFIEECNYLESALKCLAFVPVVLLLGYCIRKIPQKLISVITVLFCVYITYDFLSFYVQINNDSSDFNEVMSIGFNASFYLYMVMIMLLIVLALLLLFFPFANISEKKVANSTIIKFNKWQCSCGTYNNDDDLFCGGCGNSRAIVLTEDSSWRCDCGNINKKEDIFCGKCGQKRVEKDFWKCVCGNEVSEKDAFCGKCGSSRQRNKDVESDSGDMVFVESKIDTVADVKDVGTWKCPQCGNILMEEDNFCDKCGTKKILLANDK